MGAMATIAADVWRHAVPTVCKSDNMYCKLCAAHHQPAGDAAAGAGRLQPAKDGALQQGAAPAAGLQFSIWLPLHNFNIDLRCFVQTAVGSRTG